MGYFHAVGEGEESIGSHHGTAQVKSETAGFGYCLAQGIHAGGLPYTAGQQHIAFGQNNGVALAVLHQAVGKQQVFYLGLGGFGVGDRSQVGRTFSHCVALLYQGAAQHGAELYCRGFHIAPFQDDAVFLGFEYLQRFFCVRRSNNNLEEYLVDFLRHLCVNRRVGDDYAAEGAHGIAGKGIFPRLEHVGPYGAAAGVVVLDDGQRGRVKIVYQFYRGLYVQHIVVGNLLAVQLFGQCGAATVVCGCLMGVLAVAQRCGFQRVEGECVHLAVPVEVAEDGGVVVAAGGKRPFCKHLAFCEGGAAVMGLYALQQLAVKFLAGDNHHVLIILCSGADKRNAADVNLLYNILVRGAFRHIFVKRVEVHHHQVDVGNIVLGHLAAVTLHVAAGQDAAEHLGMQGLHPAAKDRRIACEIFYLLHLKALGCQVVVCAAGREQLGSAAGQGGCNIVYSVFVKDRYQSPFYFFDLLHFRNE